MSHRWRLLLALALAAAPVRAAAQGVSGSTPARAQVLAGTLIFIVLRDLQFGALTPGTPKTVVPASPDAGYFQVEGERNQRVSLAFTLPTQLSRFGGGGTIPVAFGAASAVVNRLFQLPSGAGSTTFDPALGTTSRFGPTPRPQLHVYLGGTASPAVGVPPGLYTAPVVLTVAYLN
ncbi:MAG TPA: hypothetical protein VLA95_10145 [Gemmatimonadales bacterium]|nr:hypothetical protein [Gemmatimonadales bacterium]